MDIRSLKSLESEPCDLLALGVADGAVEAGLTALLGAAAAAPFVAAAAAADFKGAVGSAQTWPTLGRLASPWVTVVGLGKATGDDGVDGLRRAAGAAGQAARRMGAATVQLAFGPLDATGAAAVVEGFSAGNYRFDQYKAESDRKAPCATLGLVSADLDALPRARAVAAGQSFARDLVNEPAAVIYPESLAARALALQGQGVTVTVWDEVQIRDAGMGGITAVGQGSSRPPRFIHIAYKPAGATRKVALVGKGVTFDAGGLSIKPSSGMQTMRCDMAGSACVLGVMQAVRDLQPDVEVHGIIGAAENMLGGNAYKLGDILRMYNGKTVEIHNTDAEGRLVLADCLTYASKLGVDEVVDIATLTGAAVIALGEHYTGLFTGSDALSAALLARASEAGEGLWRMPLPDFYKDMLKADWAQLKNVGGRSAGAITAALFLSEFVDGPKWAHLDIAGPAFVEKQQRHFSAGGTGAMVPTLIGWVTQG